MKITFLGATRVVTGSKYLVENNETKLLVDCGLFQGSRDLKVHNWDPFPVEPALINAIVLTHAHIDHTGYIPVLVKNGFKGKIYCSKATYELCELLLVDSGVIQEEDAANANKYGYSRHNPALPLYTEDDARKALRQFEIREYHEPFMVGKDFTITLEPCYHILGASFITIFDGKKTIVFSGDLGQFNSMTMKAPTALTYADYIVIESTYGDRLHDETDPLEALATMVNETINRGGTLIIPAFAVGRTQTIIYSLFLLRQQKRIAAHTPIFLDSPMAINVSKLFCKYHDEHILSQTECQDVFGIVTYTRTVEESKRIDQMEVPIIIIAASGMAEGGRVLHHLKHFISDPQNTILFVGFQAGGTYGRLLVDGAGEIKIHGVMYPVNAHIETMYMFSAHADYNEILQWLSFFKKRPQKLFVTHGEVEAAEALQAKIVERFGWDVVVPHYLDSFDLT